MRAVGVTIDVMAIGEMSTVHMAGAIVPAVEMTAVVTSATEMAPVVATMTTRVAAAPVSSSAMPATRTIGDSDHADQAQNRE